MRSRHKSHRSVAPFRRPSDALQTPFRRLQTACPHTPLIPPERLNRSPASERRIGSGAPTGPQSRRTRKMRHRSAITRELSHSKMPQTSFRKRERVRYEIGFERISYA
jgi:hypothetical protein